MTEVCRQCPFFRASFLIVLIMISPGIVVSESDLLTNFFSGYDNAVRPDLDKNKPLVISSDLYVEAFGNIKEANMEYLVHCYFRQKWKDSRLAGRLKYPLTLKGAGIENIWVPDPYCYNARESNMMMPDTQLHSRISVDPSGDVLYSKGLTLLASCNMDLRNFPLDSQSCSLKFGSYGYTTNDIIYEWSPAGVVVGNNEMAQFEYKRNNISSSIENFSVGNFSTISVKFLFERRVGYYLIQVYFPDIFVVALSWIVFWMDKTEMGDRKALGITTILAIMFLLGSLNGNLPKVSYPKALDWYLLVSFSFVFMSLVECMMVFILNLRASGCKINELSLSKRIFSSIKGAIGRFDQSITGYNGSSKTTRTGFEDDDLEMVNLASKADKSVIDDATVDFADNEKSGISADSLDKASRVLFPLSFITFNIVYWVYFSLFG